MNKALLAAGVCLAALTGAAVAAPVGNVSAGYSYIDVDSNVFSGKSVNWNQFNLAGSAGYDVGSNWTIQGDFTFRSDRLSIDSMGSYEVSLDSWRAGGEAYWRDQSQSLAGFELAYTSVDVGPAVLDGVLVGLRGEVFASDTITYGAAISYNAFSGKGTDLRTWNGNAFLTYYAAPKTALSLRLGGSTTDIDSAPFTPETWSVGGDVEYLLDSNLSLIGGLEYRTTDFTVADFDTLAVSARLKVYFGTEGTLVQQHRTTTLEPSSTAGLPFPFL